MKDNFPVDNLIHIGELDVEHMAHYKGTSSILKLEIINDDLEKKLI